MSWGERHQLAELLRENEKLKKRIRKAFIAGWNIVLYRYRDGTISCDNPTVEAAWNEYLERTDEEGE